MKPLSAQVECTRPGLFTIRFCDKIVAHLLLTQICKSDDRKFTRWPMDETLIYNQEKVASSHFEQVFWSKRLEANRRIIKYAVGNGCLAVEIRQHVKKRVTHKRISCCRTFQFDGNNFNIIFVTSHKH